MKVFQAMDDDTPQRCLSTPPQYALEPSDGASPVSNSDSYDLHDVGQQVTQELPCDQER